MCCKVNGKGITTANDWNNSHSKKSRCGCGCGTKAVGWVGGLLAWLVRAIVSLLIGLHRFVHGLVDWAGESRSIAGLEEKNVLSIIYSNPYKPSRILMHVNGS